MNMKDFFTKKDKSLIFTGEKLTVTISKRFEGSNCLIIGNTVITMGIFDININDKHDVGYELPAMVEICPSETTTVNRNGDAYLVLTLYKNDIFIKDVNIIRDQKLANTAFHEGPFTGNYPNFIDYDKSAFYLDVVCDITKTNFRVNHVINEFISAVTFRDADDITKQARHGNSKKPPICIPLRLISQIAESTTGKIMGSYMEDGIESAIVNAADKNSKIEDILRQ